ncbi:MAG: 3-hydroxyacyl-CoA dehydrogenase/enoyl-CoA hydratase family protein [Chloracidobacterium sp.]|nr:3-hydroxyacyl-CoA dehydrogenase/enoyl-CoA hydratase family protein [Chloracidobacterium sp.]
MRSTATVGVVGAGTMGSAIAQHFLMKGLSVVLVDRSEEFVSKGLGHIRSGLDEAKDRRLINDDEYERVVAGITCSTRLADLSNVGFLVEAVFEDLSVKKELFKELEAVVSDKCILATNTSSFLVTDIARNLRHPERVVGVHYFYHAAKNKLVELIAGEDTDAEILTNLENFYARNGKIPIIIQDSPGFAINRFFVPWLNEAARLYEEGAGSVSAIDQIACEAFGIGMGPFALMNATGVSIAQHAARGLAEKLGPFYAPADILTQQVESGENWSLDDKTVLRGGKNNESEVRQRLLGTALGIASQVVSEDVVDETSVDLGSRTGLRWPLGPFELINRLGLEKVRSMVASVFEPWRMPLPDILSSRGKAITLDLVQAKMFGKSGFIILNIPDRMNALGEEVMSQLGECFDSLDAGTDIEKIFIVGKGKAFIAGADIKFFLEAIAAADLDRIQRFTESGQNILNKIGSSTKATYAYLDGLTLGGGFEVALACKYRIATRNTVLAFPETGIGIYPGLGGTQRTPRLVGKPLAKMLIATGKFVNADQAVVFGLADAVIEPVFDYRDLDSFSVGPTQEGTRQTDDIGIAFSDFDGIVDDELFKNSAFGVYEKQLRAKAPIALKTAMRLVDEGGELALEDALKLELRGLKQIFSTKDAQIGLSSIITGKRPEFIGC